MCCLPFYKDQKLFEICLQMQVEGCDTHGWRGRVPGWTSGAWDMLYSSGTDLCRVVGGVSERPSHAEGLKSGHLLLPFMVFVSKLFGLESEETSAFSCFIHFIHTFLQL